MRDLGDVFFSLLGTLFIALLSIGVYSTTQDHSVRRYYVGESENSDRGFLVMAERNWMDDDIAYVTDDIYKAIDVANKLNEGLKK